MAMVPGSLEDIVLKHVAPYSFSCVIFGNYALHLEVGADKASIVEPFGCRRCQPPILLDFRIPFPDRITF